MFVKIREHKYINPDMFSMIWIRKDEVEFELEKGIFSIGVGDLGRKEFEEFRQRMIDYLEGGQVNDRGNQKGYGIGKKTPPTGL